MGFMQTGAGPAVSEAERWSGTALATQQDEDNVEASDIDGMLNAVPDTDQMPKKIVINTCLW